jgi:tRNA modification GTPase
MDEQTIVAPATPVGESGVGIVRLSGARSVELLDLFFRPSRQASPLPSHRLCHGHFVAEDGMVVDEVMAVVMLHPHSYTREDVAEVHCHGGSTVMRRILDVFLAAGARLARPGEFTLRAFLNGRIDLAQAEGVIELIRARSEGARRLALGQVEGRLSLLIRSYRDRLVDALTLVEACIDFPEEDLAAELEPAIVAAGLILNEVNELLSTFDQGRILRDGVSVLLLGRPNVGKSSLLNAIVGEARAIVTDVAGTTRDLIEESLALGGLSLRLIDAAGIRDTSEPVELEGVRRARSRAREADLVLLVLDGSQAAGADDLLAFQACDPQRTLVVLNKGDLPLVPLFEPFTRLPSVRVSAHGGEGLRALREAIVGFFASDGEVVENNLVAERRHYEALLRCREALSHIASFSDVPAEFLALDLRDALDALGDILGVTTPADILERIFSRFCIGK